MAVGGETAKVHSIGVDRRGQLVFGVAIGVVFTEGFLVAAGVVLGGLIWGNGGSLRNANDTCILIWLLRLPRFLYYKMAHVYGVYAGNLLLVSILLLQAKASIFLGISICLCDSQ